MIDWKRTVVLRAQTDDFAQTLRQFLEQGQFLEQAERALDQSAPVGDQSPVSGEKLRALAQAAAHLGLYDLALLCEAAGQNASAIAAADVAQIRHSYQASKTAYLTGLTAHAPTAQRFAPVRSRIRPESRLP